MINEQTVINAFARHIKHMTFPNILFYPWESDLLALTADRRIFEYEVKLTSADYRADAKKTAKHATLAQDRDKPCPNSFAYVVPRGLSQIELPAYAGLWTFETRYDHPVWFRQERRGPSLHQRQVNEDDLMRLFVSIYYRYWRVRRDVQLLEECLSDGRNWKMMRG